MGRDAILPFESGYDIRTVQELLDHSDVKTTISGQVGFGKDS